MNLVSDRLNFRSLWNFHFFYYICLKYELNIRIISVLGSFFPSKNDLAYWKSSVASKNLSFVVWFMTCYHPYFFLKAFKGPSHLEKYKIKVTVFLIKQPLEILPVSNSIESCVFLYCSFLWRYILYLGILRQNLFITQSVQKLKCHLIDLKALLRFFLKRSRLVHSLQGTLCHGCLVICYYTIMTGLSLCVGVAERLTRDSLHTGYPWRPLWCVAERALHSRMANHCCSERVTCSNLPAQIGLVCCCCFLTFHS